MESENKVPKLERTVLSPRAITIIKSLMDQVELELGDFVQVTQKSIANYIIESRAPTFSPQEIEDIKTKNYDFIKALKRATVVAIKARQNGSKIELNDLLKIIFMSG